MQAIFERMKNKNSKILITYNKKEKKFCKFFSKVEEIKTTENNDLIVKCLSVYGGDSSEFTFKHISNENLKITHLHIWEINESSEMFPVYPLKFNH